MYIYIYTPIIPIVVEFVRTIQIKYKKIVSKRFLDTMVVLQLRDTMWFLKFRVAIMYNIIHENRTVPTSRIILIVVQPLA